MTSDSLYVAVDLGAGSGRVFLAGASRDELLLQEVRRFHYPPGRRAGHLRWDIAAIFTEIKAGVSGAGELARRLGRRIHSIGVDSWGVDYGLVDAAGGLIEDAVCYRDQRTEGAMEQVFALLGRDEIFERTGIQFLPLNTLFQLYAHTRAGIPADAAKLLLIPDLINLFLSGRAATEYSNATTTQMVSIRTGTWDQEIIHRIGFPSRLLADIIPAGTDLGPLLPAIAKEVSLDGVRVAAPATHDTGSAVLGTPLQDGWAYISSGTWSLVGVEIDSPLVNLEAARQNFTNEGGAFGTIRFLKNVMGLWILESCRKEWRERGLAVDYESLLAQIEGEAEGLGDAMALIYPDDMRFFNPPSMLGAIEEQLAESGERLPTSPPAIARLILNSLALRCASVAGAIESLTQRQIMGVNVIGGGSQNDYLNQAIATASGREVLAGPVEATAIGNVLVQAIAAGRFASLSEARHHVTANLRLRRFSPRPARAWDELARRYARLEARYNELHER